ncbi:DNA primase (plasmid) [Xanthomonas hydrangeae]|uniref:DNA primase n=1 Tax=Xanthomonas hydrangeae TaxID=2775159 RepID=UPI0019626C67|nr:DNA primase [Xanthomonas hydrangeae]CAD7741095.1 DNA primase [Xanthomonas hydrangeae]CAD7747966.1 DNA primase [Xanthomonas hydrangeae]CAD7747967.1 DNA primase [Xanthomonas hydrangeae]CAD7748156.1 DNA primase [Xanthomonas hydrangeae]
MSRIPQHFIDEMAAADLVTIIGKRVELKRAGNEYTARCPFHSENSPSFTVAQEKGFYHCFGCGAHGNAINFIMAFERLDFIPAVELVAKEVGREVPREERPFRPTGIASYAALYGLAEAAKSFYRDQLTSEQAVAYLAGRDISTSAAKLYELGYAPNEWSALKHGIAGSRERDLLAIGLLAKSERASGRTYDRFRERLMFPIRDERGRVVGFGGRAIGSATPKYLNSPDSEIFRKKQVLYGLWQALQAQRRLPRVLVVEGFIDVVTMAQYDAGAAVATMGTAFSDAHATLLFRYTDQVYFCFDGDRAGRAAAYSAARTVLPHLGGERQAAFVFLPECEDPDSLVRSRGVEDFHQLLSQAQPLSEFLFAELQRGVDLAGIEGRARLAERAFPVIDTIAEGAFKELMRRHLVALTGLSGRPTA